VLNDHTNGLIIPGITSRLMRFEKSATSRIPVIFLSAKSKISDITSGLQLGADDYISKPFDYKELLARVDRIEKFLRVIESGADGLVDAYRERIRKRITELLEKTAIDETRLAQEVAYLAERSDITEEIARLNSHIVQLRELLAGDGEIGKKLDFLLQETNREANTILSKSSELSICDSAIEIKTEVEKLREQSQNVE